MCGLGSIMAAALPGAMRLSSESNLLLTKDEKSYGDLDEVDRMVMANLSEDAAVTLDLLEKLDSKSKIQRSIQKLLQLGLIDMVEEMTDQVKPIAQDYVKLCEKYQDQETLGEFMNGLTNAPKQLELVMSFVALTNSSDTINSKEVLKSK